MLHEASKDVISLLCINNELSYEVHAAAPFPVTVPQETKAVFYTVAQSYCALVSCVGDGACLPCGDCVHALFATRGPGP